MTHLCYSLDEAAQQLDVSETVLVRLSQALRVPESAYEESGFLSFKGDLSFTDHDITFFRQVKQQLLAGETLEDVKRRIRNHGPTALETPTADTPAATEPASFAQTLTQQADQPVKPQIVRRPSARPEPAPQAAEPVLNEVIESTPEAVDALATKDFERYKHQNRPGAFKLFENILSEIKPQKPETQSEKRILPLPHIERGHFTPSEEESTLARYSASELEDDVPTTDDLYANHDPRPRLPGLFGKKTEKTQKPAPKKAPSRRQPEPLPEAALPEEKPGRPARRQPAPEPLPETAAMAASSSASPWDDLIRQSCRDPRELNIHLKTAAQVLREKALRQGTHPGNGPQIRFNRP